jgi:cytochrome oxidase Cu insertion factor (SCO1/SenC/PrrC family)
MITKGLSLLVLLVAMAALTAAQSPSPTPAKPAPPAPHTNLKVGDAAPDFTLRATDGKTYKLSDFKTRKNVVLAMYVLAFTGG